MAVHLIVTAPFADYQRGERIRDPETVAAILAGEQARMVVKVAPDAAEPAPPQEG